MELFKTFRNKFTVSAYELYICRPIVGSEPLVAAFRGLEYMNDDPAEVDVLYGMVELTDGSDR